MLLEAFFFVSSSSDVAGDCGRVVRNGDGAIAAVVVARSVGSVVHSAACSSNNSDISYFIVVVAAVLDRIAMTAVLATSKDLQQLLQRWA